PHQSTLLPYTTLFRSRAYRDLNRTLIGIGTHHKKDFLVDNTKASLVKFVSHLSDVESQSECDEIHQSWCQERISFFGSHPHQSRSEEHTSELQSRFDL